MRVLPDLSEENHMTFEKQNLELHFRRDVIRRIYESARDLWGETAAHRVASAVVDAYLAESESRLERTTRGFKTDPDVVEIEGPSS